jgi:hypothetical protein
LIDKGKEIERTFTAAVVEFIDPNRLHAGKVAVGDAPRLRHPDLEGNWMTSGDIFETQICAEVMGLGGVELFAEFGNDSVGHGVGLAVEFDAQFSCRWTRRQRRSRLT